MIAHPQSRMESGRLSSLIAVGLVFSIVFTALAHGAVEPWSVMVFQLVVLALVALWAVKILVDKRFTIRIPDIVLPIGALAVIGLAQSVAFTGASGSRSSLSFDVEATRATVTVLLFLLVTLIIFSNFFAGRARLFKLAGFLVIYGMAMAVFALVQHFTWNGKFYWIRPNTVSTSPFGPFVNHNHFAGYMELLVLLPIALVITRAVRSETRLLYAFASALMGVTVFASLSRGGMISLSAGMLFLVVMSGWLPKYGKTTRRGGLRESASPAKEKLSSSRGFRFSISQAAAILLMAAAIIAGVIWIGGSGAVINRVTQGQTDSAGQAAKIFQESRGWVWRDTLTMIRANPLLGVGLGAYGTAFSIYSQSDGSIRVPQAHNDYLQIVSDCGIAGGIVALWFLVLVFRAIFRAIRSSDPVLGGLALGSGAGIFAILVHSLFDFNLQLPANALLFLVLVSIVSNVAANVGDASIETKANEAKSLASGGRESVPAGSVARGASL